MGESRAVPEGAAPALTHVYQHVDTHGVCGTCYTSSPAPGEPARATLGLGLLGSGREGLDSPRLLSGTEFEPGEPVWLLRGSLAREQMGVPMAILMGRPQPGMPVQGGTGCHCARGNLKPWRKKIARICNTRPYALRI